jgi:hypothetical protein
VNETGKEREPGHASWHAAALLLLQARDAGSLGREGIEWEEAYEENSVKNSCSLCFLFF